MHYRILVRRSAASWRTGEAQRWARQVSENLTAGAGIMESAAGQAHKISKKKAFGPELALEPTVKIFPSVR